MPEAMQPIKQDKFEQTKKVSISEQSPIRSYDIGQNREDEIQDDSQSEQDILNQEQKLDLKAIIS